MKESDLTHWVEQAEDARTRRFRTAVHTVLAAIAGSAYLNKQMIMKGGMLLAVRYDSRRFTRDIDFSTHRKRSAFDEKEFLEQLRRALALTVEKLDYGLDCRVQSHEFKPPASNATFPTLKIRIGYSEKANRRAHKRLLAGNSSEVVEIDYSMNEKTLDVEFFVLTNAGNIQVYSLSDLIAEKFRAVLQQESRGRFRRQDVYDLHFLISNCPVHDRSRKAKILEFLLKKSESRGLKIDKDSMTQKETIERSRKNYHTLEAEVEGKLPDFDEINAVVTRYYESLPWEASSHVEKD